MPADETPARAGEAPRSVREDAAGAPPVPDGLHLRPFRALRYAAGLVDEVGLLTSPPYDVVDAAGVSRLEALDPRNVVRLILPRDGDDGDRYARAAATLQSWRDAGVLRPDPTPALYVYEMTTPGGHSQRGLVGALDLAAPEAGVILPHENTMAGPVADRLALYTAVEADLEPVFLVHEGGGAAGEVVAGADAVEPLLVARTDDGVTHRVWSVTEPDALQAVAEDLLPRRAVIADGHHRYATYLRRQADAHAAGRGAGPWDQGLALLVDTASYGPEVHAIHRVLPGLPAAGLAERAAGTFRVRPVAGGADEGLAALTAADGPGFVLVGADGAAWLLDRPDPAALADALPADRSAAWRSLDVTVLHVVLVGRVWGLEDTVDVVGFEHDVPSALAAAARTSGSALLLAPTPVEAVAAVARAGERMPRKSTLFTPKPRSGLLLRAFADA